MPSVRSASLVFQVAVLCAASALVGSAQTVAKQGAAAADLRVSDLIVSQFEDGPPVPAGQKLVSGETGYFRFSAAGFKTMESGRVQLTGHAQVFDPLGTPVMPQDEVAIATSLRDEDKDWKPFLKFQFQLPPIARPGVYRIKYEVTDDQSKKTASAEGTFGVAGRNVPPSPTLVIRDLAFYRTADDDTPLKIPAYRSGDSVWMKFDATGYKYGEQNAIDVSYDVAVTFADGNKPLFSQQDAAGEKSQAYYPQPWVPGAFSLTLQSNMKVGDYNVEITARDAVGNQTAKAAATFKVE